MQRTMTEKDSFLQAFEREYETTRRVLEAYPPEKADLKPAEKSKRAIEVAWMLVLNQMVPVPVLENTLQPGSFPHAPKTWDELIPALDKAHRETMEKLARSGDQQWQGSTRMPIGPHKVGDLRAGDALWFFLHDTIHHRGQLTVYLRIAGGKVPSIYGPTADEPWT
jgi:uncharacterized damage-inducible protein DinB